jgi:hypothetical protein
MWTSEPKPHEINRLLVSFRFRSSQTRVPQSGANFGIGTLGGDKVRPTPLPSDRKA